MADTEPEWIPSGVNRYSVGPQPQANAHYLEMPSGMRAAPE